ncbi:[FeFe] hydrogenase H-cluster maturation GTPase HydF [Anaerotignum lactatifermentans]|uniref:[FeFe] hydrogenase H-cluster maturation GTPase HydF n=1 Tax=Anaerotignum lactatifermentans TaxID=160404 RepID=A0ABS2G915_9FIRM|nr:[FeFe] hydrogenase H-cluster maturation GTPase HydF [Anaerotignum lactatifermentans]MBM6828554.1 [FeFe] hydrogenase H-cluster maturation GTPase HydF [Anaerotignum lactatifermentans]MBM6877961.1 [FeFe] hydrogenase H-cluster maturation GTPase HydF [Anaerotignum lactatifermentans]MBM6950136.1 [FeFe] hydrogenase H-cluster maturation GTPase HydF [Anaerotignum lactatifermentans]
MGLQDTPSAERVQIGFFGCRNAGKSSLVNAITNQEMALVSPVKGTTTDPVTKAMELLPLGPVLIIDTPGIDDEGGLGEQRVRRTKQVLNRIDCAVLVVDSQTGKTAADLELMELFHQKQVPFLIAYNKSDLRQPVLAAENEIAVSALRKTGIEELKEQLAQLGKSKEQERTLVRDLVSAGDLVVLVTPIDSAAPKGRLILPQQQTIRDLLEANAVPVVTKENMLSSALSALGKKPTLVITDSQVFAKANADTPKDIPLTSFSILMARYKGFLTDAVLGVAAIETLDEGDKVLICEGCTHHRQCEDIGTVKIPRWLRQHTGKNLELIHTSGKDFPEDLSSYKLVIHCGGCMLNEREITYRRKCAADAGVPFTNYGIAIAYMTGILKRSIEIFPSLHKLI